MMDLTYKINENLYKIYNPVNVGGVADIIIRFEIKYHNNPNFSGIATMAGERSFHQIKNKIFNEKEGKYKQEYIEVYEKYLSLINLI